MPLFRRKKIAPGSVVEERWETNFGPLRERRFALEETESYSVRNGPHSLVLELGKTNVFAWAENPVHRYKDFILEAEIAFDADNGHGAAGFLFKFINQENFYYFLLSNDGMFRFDVVMNGNPRPIIGWTPSPAVRDASNRLRIVAQGYHYLFSVNDEWIAESDDETIPSGGIAFGGQNFGDRDRALFRLTHFAVDSRAREVMLQYYRWSRFIDVDRDARLALGRTYFGQGNFLGASIQARRILREHAGDADALFLLALSGINLGLYVDALSAVEKCIAVAPENKDAFLEKAKLLYLLNRFLELRQFCSTTEAELGSNAVFRDLYGNAEFNLGNWESAAREYGRAAELDPSMPLYRMNQLRAFEKAGTLEENGGLCLSVAIDLFRQEAFDDLNDILPLVRKLQRDDPGVAALEGKIAFHEERYEDAKRFFRTLEACGQADASVHYLLGTISSGEGRTDEAIGEFRQACALEPEYPLFRFRLAETLHLSGRDAREDLQQALALGPEDPWTWNLAGLVALSGGAPKRAEECFETAMRLAPNENAIALNYAEALFEADRADQAFQILAGLPETVEGWNLRGNLLFRLERFEDALVAYDKALVLDANDPDILENAARACRELRQLNRAEELAARAMEAKSTTSIYLLLADIARLKGEFARAEVALLEAIEQAPHVLECRLALGRLYTEIFKFDKARRVVEALMSVADDVPEVAASAGDRNKAALVEAARTLLERIDDAVYRTLHCSDCHRTWKVPRALPSQRPVRLVGEPPDEAPAGECPTCGRIICIGCAKEHVSDGRLLCPHCKTPLKLSRDDLNYLLLSIVKREADKESVASLDDVKTDSGHERPESIS